MKNKISMQWQLTFLTAILVTVACIALQIFLSNSAMFYMDFIGNSMITVFPESEMIEEEQVTEDFSVNIPTKLEKEIQRTQNEFLEKSIVITCGISVLSSALIYFIVGLFLKPVKQLERQVKDIEMNTIDKKISIKTSTRELALLESSFNNMLKRLEESFSVQKQFSANAAHELRTPLAIMKTNIEVFYKQRDPKKTDYEETIHMVDVQIERLSNIIQTLLQMTETQTAEKDHCVSISDLTEEIFCDLTNLANEKNIHLYQMSGNVHVMGNDMLLYRAIYNLIENAIKYNKEGGSVTVEIREEDEFAKVIIIDTGIGIDFSQQEKIFDPFYRVDKSRSREMGGAGLGLSLVQEIAKRHDGYARVVQSTTDGTKIELVLKKE